MIKNYSACTSLVGQRLSLRAFNAGDAYSIPGQGTKIPHAMRCGQEKIKNKQLLSMVGGQWSGRVQQSRASEWGLAGGTTKQEWSRRVKEAEDSVKQRIAGTKAKG